MTRIWRLKRGTGCPNWEIGTEGRPKPDCATKSRTSVQLWTLPGLILDFGTGLGPDTWAGGLVHKVRDWESLDARTYDLEPWRTCVRREGRPTARVCDFRDCPGPAPGLRAVLGLARQPTRTLLCEVWAVPLLGHRTPGTGSHLILVVRQTVPPTMGIARCLGA